METGSSNISQVVKSMSWALFSTTASTWALPRSIIGTSTLTLAGRIMHRFCESKMPIASTFASASSCFLGVEVRKPLMRQGSPSIIIKRPSLSLPISVVSPVESHP